MTGFRLNTSMKVLKIVIVFLFVSLFSFETYGQDKLESQVITALLDKGRRFIPEYKITHKKVRIKSFNRIQDPAYVLLNVTTNPTNDATFDTTGMFDRKVLLEKDRDILIDFCEKNSAPLSLDYGFGKKTNVTYIRNADYKKLFAKNDWHLYYKKYDLKPMVMISRPGFNKRKNKALIYLTYSLGETDGAGYYMVLKKSWGKWKQEGFILIWLK